MSNSAFQVCRLYDDFLLRVLDAFGERPFFVRELPERGITFPKGRTLMFFKNSGVFREHKSGRPASWVLNPTCREYLQRRRAACGS